MSDIFERGPVVLFGAVVAALLADKEGQSVRIPVAKIRALMTDLDNGQSVTLHVEGEDAVVSVMPIAQARAMAEQMMAAAKAQRAPSHAKVMMPAGNA